MGSAQASNYVENGLVDHYFRSGSLPKPAGLYFALFTAAPSDAGGGTEVAGGGYARVNLPPSDTNWKSTQGTLLGASTGTGGQTSNAAVIVFPTPTAPWGVCTHFAIFDAATGGNILFWDALVAPRNVQVGDAPPQFAADAVVITVA